MSFPRKREWTEEVAGMVVMLGTIGQELRSTSLYTAEAINAMP
jgi:hypothetical protein